MKQRPLNPWVYEAQYNWIKKEKKKFTTALSLIEGCDALFQKISTILIEYMDCNSSCS